MARRWLPVEQEVLALRRYSARLCLTSPCRAGPVWIPQTQSDRQYRRASVGCKAKTVQMHVPVASELAKSSQSNARGVIRVHEASELKISISQQRRRCPTCQRPFSSSYNMRVHMRIHNNSRPFECKFCPKNFRTKCNLEHHVQTHTGNWKFKCRLCGKGYSRKDRLLRHMNWHPNKSVGNNKCFP
mmetsp:Transcript_23888/g.46840  ORF Transcript_23888/g.46840 Transcript_23888/m.46840 type:complete len:186 (+) Transcript_23888:76-633(+)